MDLTKRRPLHENKNFRVTKICERTEKIIFSLAFVCFRFTEMFSELSFKRKCKKAASFSKYLFLRKYEILVYDSCT